MHRTTTAFLVLALAAGAVSITASGSARAMQATIRVASKQPLVLRGAGFEPRELVRVTVTTDESTVHRIRAGSRGGFTASFGDVSYDCRVVLLVRATGSRGSRATLKVLPRECPPPPTIP